MMQAYALSAGEEPLTALQGSSFEEQIPTIPKRACPGESLLYALSPQGIVDMRPTLCHLLSSSILKARPPHSCVGSDYRTKISVFVNA